MSHPRAPRRLRRLAELGGMSESARPAKFRETLWFLKGSKDAEAADVAAESGDLFATDAADMLPIEDRYMDDGTVRPSMSNMFGLHTGTTSYITPVVAFSAAEPGGTSLNTKAM